MNATPDGSDFDPDRRRIVTHKRAPASNRPVGLMIAAGLEAWTAVYTAWTARGTARALRAAFSERGVHLPAGMHSAFEFPWIWWLFAGLAVAQLLGIHSVATDEPTEAERRRMKSSLWIFGVTFAAALGWGLYGLYSMIFQVASKT
jgi:hypothetical protein